jgi:AcrR family transcriptional regulator
MSGNAVAEMQSSFNGQNHDDQRVRRTRKAIVSSFNDLVLNRPYLSILVKDIIGAAGVGRATFYEHFRNKDDLLRHAASHLLAVLADAVTDASDHARISHVLGHFLDHRQAALSLLRPSPQSPNARELAALVEARLSAICLDGGASLIIPLRLAADQIAESQLALIRAWLNSTVPCPPGVIATALQRTSRSAAASLVSQPAAAEQSAPDPRSSCDSPQVRS